ncbi:MAG: carbamoyltransferase C-terminal domain-containing protein, partial [Elusimicrobia bacterium]|nr:carbamoyltransferase C-terminal domain-containing protein [Elusimicrobiota bacterium]
VGQGRDLRLDKELRFPHSLGLLYSAVTAHLGFKVNGGEGKVMGLAAYGKPAFAAQFKELVRVREDGSFQLDLKYFSFHYDLVMTNCRFARLLFPPRPPESELRQEHCDLAATLQAVVEDAAVKLVRGMHAAYRMDDLCLAGGVALNCVANGALLERAPIRRLFVQPAAGDDGCALGAALYVHNRLFAGGRPRPMTSAALGPEFSDDEAQAALQEAGLSYARLAEPDLLARTAQRLAAGKIVGWFQGRMEFGPRALGHRSILADPRDPGMKDALNRRVKHREPFRPFAPALCAEDRDEYFAGGHDSPFMLLSFPVRPDKRDVIPAAVHVDGSARLQTVTAQSHPLFHGLIKEFGRRTGVPVLLNTSFNVRGEPIVCDPRDAVATFLGTGLDCMAINHFFIEKEAENA